MKYEIFTDGAARGNPGDGAIGFAVHQDSLLVWKQSKLLGHTTNNKAEYLLLSEFGLYSISAGSTTPSLVQLYDQNTKDMLMVGDEVYLLSTSGLWLYNQTDDTLSLVSGFPENEIYVPDSLTYVDGGFAFSSILTDAALRDIDTPLSSSSIYFVTLE